MDDAKLLDANEAYQAERARWGMRYNKMLSPAVHEIYRSDADGDPIVQASTTGGEAAIYELDEMRAVAAMRAAATVLLG